MTAVVIFGGIMVLIIKVIKESITPKPPAINDFITTVYRGIEPLFPP